MKKNNKLDVKEVGLALGLILSRYFLESENLHYGYWADGLEVSLSNFPLAQEKHTEFILDHIPRGARTVLDVGCGAGALARRLADRGFQVDCVSPSPLLTRRVREVMGQESRIFECRFEEVTTDKRYDVVLFSESFQYVAKDKAVAQSARYAKEGGFLLICDFFKTDTRGRSPVAGGHRLSLFRDLMKRSPFEPVEDVDITAQMAPNMLLVNEVLSNVGVPLWELLFLFMTNRLPRLSRFLRWALQRKIEKMERRYFRGAITPEVFARMKTYRLLVYRRTNGESPGSEHSARGSVMADAEPAAQGETPPSDSSGTTRRRFT